MLPRRTVPRWPGRRRGRSRRRSSSRSLGDVDGYLQLLPRMPMSYTARASSAAQCLLLPVDRFEVALATHPALSKRWLTSIADRLAASQRRLVNLLGHAACRAIGPPAMRRVARRGRLAHPVDGGGDARCATADAQPHAARLTGRRDRVVDLRGTDAGRPGEAGQARAGLTAPQVVPGSGATRTCPTAAREGGRPSIAAPRGRRRQLAQVRSRAPAPPSPHARTQRGPRSARQPVTAWGSTTRRR